MKRFFIRLLALVIICTASIQSLAAESKFSLHPQISLQQGVQYSFVDLYKLHSLQYDGSLAAGLEFYFDKSRLGITPRIQFFYTPPPSVSGPFGFRGDFGYGLGFSLDYHIIRQSMILSLAGDFRFLRYWYTSVAFVSPQAGLEYTVALPGLSNALFSEKVAIFAKFSTMYRFRLDADVSTSLNGGLVLRF